MTTNKIIDQLNDIRWNLLCLESKIIQAGQNVLKKGKKFYPSDVCILIALIKEDLDPIIKPIKELIDELEEENID